VVVTPTTPPVPAATRWRTVGVVTFVVAAVLLLSTGGAALAAPVTLPLMWVATAHHPTRPFRAIALLLGGFTTLEAFWVLTYLAVGEVQPWIWMVPLLAAALWVWLLATGRPRPTEPLDPPGRF
jgi:hypothetical protein